MMLTEAWQEELLWDGFDRVFRLGLEQGLASLWEEACQAGLEKIFQHPNTLLDTILATVSEADCGSLRSTLQNHQGLAERLQALGRYLDSHQEYLEKHAKVCMEMQQRGEESRKSALLFLSKYQALWQELMEAFLSQEKALLTIVTAVIVLRLQVPDSTPSFEETFDGLAQLLDKPLA